VTSALADLLLVRHLVPGKGSSGLAAARLLAAAPLATDGDCEGRIVVETALEELLSRGDLERTGAKTRLTEAGCARALGFLGLFKLPSGTGRWDQLRDRYLIPRLLAGDPSAPGWEKRRQRLAKIEGVRADLLRRRFELSCPPAPSLSQALDALAWQQPGAQSNRRFSRQAVLAHHLARHLGREERLEPAQAVAHLAAAEVGVKETSASALRQGIVRAWLSGSLPVAIPAPVPAPAPVPVPVPVPAAVVAPAPAAVVAPAPAPAPAPVPAPEPSLEDFATRVLDAARRSPRGRFGSHKVFINHVWRGCQPELPGLDEGAFKRRLTEANRRGLLGLSRADLVEAMDPADVIASETRYLNGTFHFVRTA
jgi:hypothetical protein